MPHDPRKDRDFYDALRERRYGRAVALTSPAAYLAYLRAGEDEEASMHAELEHALAHHPGADLAFNLAQRWFGLGLFREPDPNAPPRRESALAALAAQQTQVLRVLLGDPGMSVQERAATAIALGLIQPVRVAAQSQSQALLAHFQGRSLPFLLPMMLWSTQLQGFHWKISMGWL